jgi:hypothetical protein
MVIFVPPPAQSLRNKWNDHLAYKNVNITLKNRYQKHCKGDWRKTHTVSHEIFPLILHGHNQPAPEPGTTLEKNPDVLLSLELPPPPYHSLS